LYYLARVLAVYIIGQRSCFSLF